LVVETLPETFTDTAPFNVSAPIVNGELAVRFSAAPSASKPPPVITPVPPKTAPLCTATAPASEPLNVKVPALTVVTPEKVLLPVNVNVPLPILFKASAPLEFCIAPEKVVFVISITVKTGEPPAETLSTVPLPERLLTLALKPATSSVPLTMTLPAPAPLGIAVAAPSASVPAEIVVLPD
jgi:hypothetical protein